MARFICKSCGYSKTVGDELIGKRGRCRECGEITLVAGDAAMSGFVPLLSSPMAAEKLNTRAGAQGFGLIFYGTFVPLILGCVIVYLLDEFDVDLSEGASMALQRWILAITVLCVPLVLSGIVRLLGVSKSSRWISTTIWTLVYYIGSLPLLYVFYHVALEHAAPAASTLGGFFLLPAPMACALLYLLQLRKLVKQSVEMLHVKTLRAAQKTYNKKYWFLAPVLMVLTTMLAFANTNPSWFWTDAREHLCALAALGGFYFIGDYVYVLAAAMKAYGRGRRRPRRPRPAWPGKQKTK